MPQRNFFVVTGISVFDFELFIGERYQFVSSCWGTILRLLDRSHDAGISRNASSDNNLRQVQKQLGYASPAMTANISFEDMQNGVTGLYQ
jgi:hypothetical protein